MGLAQPCHGAGTAAPAWAAPSCPHPPRSPELPRLRAWPGHLPGAGVTITALLPSFYHPKRAMGSAAFPACFSRQLSTLSNLWHFPPHKNTVSRGANPKTSPTNSGICTEPFRHMEPVTSYEHDYCLRPLCLISLRLLATLKMLLTCS